tara:strand:+ start:2585 stop:2740 length:156 start_codon:yes stop_codon:yes gene_type:complete
VICNNNHKASLQLYYVVIGRKHAGGQFPAHPGPITVAVALSYISFALTAFE